MKRHFHLVPTPLWEAHAAAGGGDWTPPRYAAEGFVHLSYAPQLAGTLGAHFQGVDAVTLLELDPARLSELVEETSRGGALFPHHYAPLPANAFLRRWDLVRADGELTPPALADDPSGDLPPGRAPLGRRGPGQSALGAP